jgi:hypothetical protein
MKKLSIAFVGMLVAAVGLAQSTHTPPAPSPGTEPQRSYTEGSGTIPGNTHEVKAPSQEIPVIPAFAPTASEAAAPDYQAGAAPQAQPAGPTKEPSFTGHESSPEVLPAVKPSLEPGRASELALPALPTGPEVAQPSAETGTSVAGSRHTSGQPIVPSISPEPTPALPIPGPSHAEQARSQVPPVSTVPDTNVQPTPAGPSHRPQQTTINPE